MKRPRLVRTSIEVLGFNGAPRGVLSAPAWGHQDFAVHQHVNRPDLWVITIKPLGLCLPTTWCSFNRLRDAALAMIEIAALRNDWHIITQADLTPALGEKIKAIASRHHPDQSGFRSLTHEAGKSLTGRPLRLNGYVNPMEIQQ